MAEAVLVHEPLDLQALLILRPHRGVEGVRDAQRLLVLVLAAEIVRLLADAHALQHNAVGRSVPQLAERGEPVLPVQYSVGAVLPVTDHQHAQLGRVKVLHDARNIAHVHHPLIFLRHDARQRNQLDLLAYLAYGAIAVLLLLFAQRYSLCRHCFPCLCVHRFPLPQILRPAERARFPVCHCYPSLSFLSVAVF